MATPFSPPSAPLTTTGRWLILLIAFFGWLFAGVHMSITQLTGQAAAIDLLDRTSEIEASRYLTLNERVKAKADLSAEEDESFKTWNSQVARWFSWFQCAFLFGAATGGFIFGWLGDRIGRSKAMAASILTYSSLAAATSLAQSPQVFWILWFLASTGVGGMWPNGVALVSEAWSSMSRPAVAGVIGTAANIGIFLMASLDRQVGSAFDQWRWAFHVSTAPVVLGVVALILVPESPRWLATQTSFSPPTPLPGGEGRAAGIFRPPLLQITLLGIVLATIPMIGGWGTANWMVPWAEKAGNAALKSQVLQARALTGIVGSLLGGWIASMLGRRPTYFAVSMLSLGIAQYIFWMLVPTDTSFLIWVAMLGFVSGVYFGWLPLCLPEMFPTRHRATGAGVGFNFGRIITAITIFVTGAITHLFDGNYARIGQCTSLLFILGMACIWLARDTGGKQLED